MKRAEEFARTAAREMRAVGLNMDLAPVVDVRRGVPEKHLEGRMFGDRPEKVAKLGARVIKTLQKGGIMAVAKHFPGLGSARLDPHFNLLSIETGLAEMEEIDLPPFAAAIEQGVAGVMTSHALYPTLDPERPATVSAAVLTGLLRERMGFDGLIITDDLEMGAISKGQGVAKGAAEAFSAGADILLICKDQELALESSDLLRNKILREEIPLRRLHESYRRIQRAKSKFLSEREDISIVRVKEMFQST